MSQIASRTTFNSDGELYRKSLDMPMPHVSISQDIRSEPPEGSNLGKLDNHSKNTKKSVAKFGKDCYNHAETKLRRSMGEFYREQTMMDLQA